MKVNFKATHRFKTLIFILSILLIPVFIYGCKAFIEKPVKTNVFDFSSYTIKLTDNPSPVILNSDSVAIHQTDATHIEDYMLLRNMLLLFEEQDYNVRMNALKKSTESLPVDERFEPVSTNAGNAVPSQLMFQVDAYKEDTQEKSYTLWVDVTASTAVITNGSYQYTFDTDIYQSLIHSKLIVPVEDLTRIPKTEILEDKTTLITDTSAHWNQHVMDDRYVQTEIKSEALNALEVHNFSAPAVLTVKWPDNMPSDCQITFIPQTNFLTSDEEKELTLTPSETAKTPSPIILKVDGQAEVTFDLPKTQGYFLVEITSTWLPKEASDFGTTTSYLLINNDYPGSMTLQNTYIEPGDLLVFEGNNLEDASDYTITTDLTSSALTLKPYEDKQYLFVPLMSKYTPGNYYLKITDHVKQQIIAEFAVTVSKKEFQIQELSTSTATASLQNDANNKQLEEAFARARANPSDEKFWTGPFIQPVGGRISTEYGTIRYTNGAETGSRHSGIDFANPVGTPVKATQSGYVVLAEFLNITGNTLIIDHGLGFYSQYYHLDSIDVNVGDFVTVGDEVAKIGTTGFSTGPHLHFTIYYGGINLNPWKFFENAPF